MVYLHGGGFYEGNGNAESCGPDFIIERDIILVSLNYRLGPLGFLSLQNDDIPGNAGLKDQLLALKWVNKNIIHFGGNPNNVTLMGHSAGSSCVHLHIVSSKSTGLFTSAIAQSGDALDPWSINKDPVERAFMLGRMVGTNSTSTEELAAFLRRVPAFELSKAQFEVKTKKDLHRCVGLPFGPVIEKNISSDAFLVENPKTLLQTGRFQQVPMIVGIVDFDGSVVLYGIKDVLQTIEDFKGYVPLDLNIEAGSQEFQDLESNVKMFYFSNKTLNLNESVERYLKICTDIEFVFGTYQTINLMVAKSVAPIYVYQFSYEGMFTIGKKGAVSTLPNLPMPKGTFHSDELGYLFYSDKVKSYTEGTKDFKILTSLTDMWTNFMKHHDPNGKQILWKPTERNDPKYLHVGKTELVNNSFYPYRMNFWNDIYKKYQ